MLLLTNRGFVLELVLTLVSWTHPSGLLCLWQCSLFIFIVYRAGYRYKSQFEKYPHDDWQIHMLTTPSYVFVYLYRQSCPPYLHSGDLQINASMEGWKGKIRKKVEVLLCLMSKWFRFVLFQQICITSEYWALRSESLFKIINLRLFKCQVPALVRTTQRGQIELPNNVLLLQEHVCWGN